MQVHDSSRLRNIAVLGHSGCGKTNLIEAISYTSSLTNKISKQNDKVNMTYSMALVPVEYNNFKYNLLDTPGYFDFSGEVISSLSASDAAIIVVDATTGTQVGTEKAVELTESIPKIMFIIFPPATITNKYILENIVNKMSKVAKIIYLLDNSKTFCINKPL